MTQFVIESLPVEIWDKVKSGLTCQIVDVREPGEYQSVHIPGSKLIPLSSIAQANRLIDKEVPSYLFCRSGKRAKHAALKLTKMGFKHITVAKDGLDAWIAAGLPVEYAASRTWSLDRQVRLCAGLFILLGIALGYTVSPNWICLAAFIALGMIFSAVTDTCGMALALARMPWNQTCTK